MKIFQIVLFLSFTGLISCQKEEIDNRPVVTITAPTTVTEGKFITIKFEHDQPYTQNYGFDFITTGSTADFNDIEFWLFNIQHQLSPYDGLVLHKGTSGGRVDILATRDFIEEGIETLTLTFENPYLNIINPVVNITITESSIDKNVVAFYPFSEDASDLGPNAVHGEVFGPSLTFERYYLTNSKSYVFDGKDDYIIIKHNDLLNFEPANTFAISLWVRPFFTQPDLSTTSNTIISKENSIGEGYPFAIKVGNSTADVNSQRKFQFFRSDSDACNYSLSAIDPEEFTEYWYHLIMMRTTDGKIKIYRNGQLVHVSDDLSICNTDNTGDIYIGRSKSGEFYRGQIDDIRIYSRELTQDEIVELSAFI